MWEPPAGRRAGGGLRLGVQGGDGQHLVAGLQRAGLAAGQHLVAADHGHQVARALDVIQIVLGESHRPRWKELVGQSIIARILRETDGVDVHIIADERPRTAGKRRPTRVKVEEAPPERGATRRRWGRMARKNPVVEIDGDAAVWGGAGFAASLLLGVGLESFREGVGLENVAMLYLVLVAATAAVGGRQAGLTSSVSAALSYNWFFTTPYHTLRIDSADQILTVLLLFAAGFLTSLGGRATRRMGVAAREEAAAIRMLTAVSLAAASGREADQVAARELLALLGARAVSVLRTGTEGEWVSAHAGEPHDGFDPVALPRLDEEGRIPSGHRRMVGGMFVLPNDGVAVDLVHRGRRVGSLVIEPEVDRPLLHSTRMAVAAAAHALAIGGDRADWSAR